MAEQFAIAEAKLRAWASMDDEDEVDDDEDDSRTNGQTHTISGESSGTSRCLQFVHIIIIIATDTSSSISPPLVLPPPGVLTLCSSLSGPHLHSCVRSAMSA